MDDEKYHTGLKRLGAAIVDAIVFAPFALIELWLFGETQSSPINFYYTVTISFLSIVYSVFAHYKYGQTIGKWAMGIKVLDVGEQRTLTLKQSIFRDLFYISIEIIALFYFLFLIIQTEKSEDIVDEYLHFADFPVLFWTLIELTSMLANSKRRAVHDFMAKSVVVRVVKKD